MNLQELIENIKKFHKKVGAEYAPQTSVVSPLFPGQFNYCLDEVNLLEKYGNLVDIGEEHFQKIQPAIRLSDYEFFYNKKFADEEHLGTFSLVTVSGFHSFSKDQSEKYYRQSIKNMLNFLKFVGLDLNKLKITYFSGNDAKSIEESRKHDPQEIDRKIRVDINIPEDPMKKIWIEEGVEAKQLEANNTRDNFLTSAWYATKAPWGYRNEIFYRMTDGNFLDIGTIERMIMCPTIKTEKNERREEIHFVTKVDFWDMGIVVDAVGVERILQALEEKSKIWEIELFSSLKKSGINIPDIERIRILHRIFTDCPKKEFHSRNRKKKTHWLMRDINHLSIDKIREILEINSELYKSIFPDLKDGVKKVINEIITFRQSSTTFKE